MIDPHGLDVLGIIAWPADWPKYRNGCRDACDACYGMCSCGAFHTQGEFHFDRCVLFRFRKAVSK